VPGAKGAVAINADAGKLVAQIISQAAGGGLGGAFGGSLATAPLGNLTGWASSSTSGMTGHLKLGIKERGSRPKTQGPRPKATGHRPSRRPARYPLFQ